MYNIKNIRVDSVESLRESKRTVHQSSDNSVNICFNYTLI